jgi:hypothetical protein
MLNFCKVSAASDGAKIRDYMTQGKPEPEKTEPRAGVDPAGRLLEPGEKLTAYYTGREERASWRPDMPEAIAKALGIDPRQKPKDAELDNLFEARRADNGRAWSKHKREISGFDFLFAPHKSVSLAAEFAPTTAEAAAIRHALFLANDDALRYAAEDLAWARKGHAGKDGRDPGKMGWVTFAHDEARPTVEVQDGPDGATYLIDAPLAGDPHFHLHNFIPNLVVTEDGRIGSIDGGALTKQKVHEYGAFFQAKLSDHLKELGIETGYNSDQQAVVIKSIPKNAVELFSKRNRQVIGDAKKYAQELNMDWDSLSFDRKKQMLHEASIAGRLSKENNQDSREIWQRQAAGIGWVHDGAMKDVQRLELTEEERFEQAYETAEWEISKEFHTAAVIDYDQIRVHAVRSLILHGIRGGRDEVDRMVAYIQARGFDYYGEQVSFVQAEREGKMRVTHSGQLRIEQSVSDAARVAAADKSGALSHAQIRAAIDTVKKEDPDFQFNEEQEAAIYALAGGSRLSLLTGVAGAGKTTVAKPLVIAWQRAGKRVVGTSTAWRQADALKDAGITETIALQPLLRAIKQGEFQPDANTILVIDEVSQIAPRPMLQLLELQKQTGMTIKMLGDREQVQAIEAGDTIELLRRVLPESELPEVLISQRQKRARDLEIATLFRDGNAQKALKMKREDGTASLLEGDYEQVIHRIADFYIARQDQLRAKNPHLNVTLTALSNQEANDLSHAIRERLKARGQIGADGTIHQAVFYKGDKAEFFEMPIATGDKLRLYRKTVATIDGKRRSVGNNGDIVEVLAKTEQGLVLRNDRGFEAAVSWKQLTDKETGRLLLGYGRALTVDAAQGMSTKGEHINALPKGTANSTAFKTYTGESRATGQTYTLISKAAVLSAVKRTQALGDISPITEDDLWKRIAKDTSEKPYKSLALDIEGKPKERTEKMVIAALKAHHKMETAVAQNPDFGQTMISRFEEATAEQVFEENRDTFKELLKDCQDELKDPVQIEREFVSQHAAEAVEASQNEKADASQQPIAQPEPAEPQEPVISRGPSPSP